MIRLFNQETLQYEATPIAVMKGELDDDNKESTQQEQPSAESLLLAAVLKLRIHILFQGLVERDPQLILVEHGDWRKHRDQTLLAREATDWIQSLDFAEMAEVAGLDPNKLIRLTPLQALLWLTDLNDADASEDALKYIRATFARDVQEVSSQALPTGRATNPQSSLLEMRRAA